MASTPGIITPVARRMLALALAAALCALAFNALAPQGVGWLPPGVASPAWRPVTAAQAVELRQKGALLVDARQASDYKLAHVRGAVNLSPGEWDLLWPLLRPTLAAAPSLVVYGRGFSRWPAAEVGQRLRAHGLARVHVLVEGCLGELEAAGAPVRRGRGARP